MVKKGRGPEIVIRVEGVKLRGYHGCHEKERKKGGPFLLSLVARYPAPAAPERDDFAGRLDYAALVELAQRLFLEQPHRLLEPVAEKIARRALKAFPALREITVSLRKLRPCLPLPLAFAEVSVTRRRRR